jgi:pyruvate ferredoxin oxidoreductase delta subunit
MKYPWICEFGTSKNNKTGNWRTFKPIVSDTCIGCGLCTKMCPEGCIKIENGKAKINYDYCKGCLICKNVCPIKAIKEEKDD